MVLADPPPHIHTSPRLPPDEVEQIVALVRQVAQVDEVSPLNDDGWLALRGGSRDVVHLRASVDDSVVGYAQLEHAGDRSTAMLAVDPDQRRRGYGTALLRATVAATDQPVGVWAFHDLPPAQALARATGWRPVRELLQMGRSLTDPVSARPDVPGITVRTFVPGQDEQPWLAVNARAFAGHPEQGRMGLAELRARMAEDWFDPSDFLLAEDDHGIVGFHWTKRHSPTQGEVYVLGVDPDTGGRGLGSALLLAGLHHLKQRGVDDVMLYVEGDHDRAVRLYAKHGFSVRLRDVMYAEEA